MLNNIVNVPKSGNDLAERMGENSKPLPLALHTSVSDRGLRQQQLCSLCLAFNGQTSHGNVWKNDSIVLATEVIKAAQKKGPNQSDHAGRVATALNHNRRREGWPKQLLLAAKGE